MKYAYPQYLAQRLLKNMKSKQKKVTFVFPSDRYEQVEFVDAADATPQARLIRTQKLLRHLIHYEMLARKKRCWLTRYSKPSSLATLAASAPNDSPEDSSSGGCAGSFKRVLNAIGFLMALSSALDDELAASCPLVFVA